MSTTASKVQKGLEVSVKVLENDKKCFIWNGVEMFQGIDNIIYYYNLTVMHMYVTNS